MKRALFEGCNVESNQETRTRGAVDGERKGDCADSPRALQLDGEKTKTNPKPKQTNAR
jgi:hypothetical protein